MEKNYFWGSFDPSLVQLLLEVVELILIDVFRLELDHEYPFFYLRNGETNTYSVSTGENGENKLFWFLFFFLYFQHRQPFQTQG